MPRLVPATLDSCLCASGVGRVAGVALQLAARAVRWGAFGANELAVRWLWQWRTREPTSSLTVDALLDGGRVVRIGEAPAAARR